MFTFLMIVEIVLSILLILVIIVQSSKGGGLASSMGGGNIGAVFGVRRTSDFLTNTTTILATLLIVLALVINLLFLPGKNTRDAESIIQSTQTSLPPPQVPQNLPK
ncbi:MAG: preprotein translocase subunit SecG [Ignavibacteria bacterium]|nr:preprotein translocase subunit SecG [Ignavibacteria bacterium]